MTRGTNPRRNDAAPSTTSTSGTADAAAGAPPAVARARLHRDGVTAAIYTALAGWAWFLYGFGSMLPLLVDAQGISNTVGGLHLTAQAVGNLVAGLCSAQLVLRLRRRRTLYVATAVVVLGISLLLVGEPTWLTLLAVFVTGMGGGLAINVVNPILGQHHGDAGPAAISEANAVAAGVGLVAPLAVGAGVQAGLGWRPALLVTLVVMMATAALFRRAPYPTPSLDTPAPRSTGRARKLPLTFWPLMVVIMLCVGVEFSVTTWTAELLRREIGLSDGFASAGVSAVVAGMALGRLGVSRLALRVPARPMLVGAILVALAGWGVLFTAGGPVQAVLGLLLTGLGIAGQFPLGLSLVLAATPGLEDRASAMLSISISAAIGAAPFGLGALADATSIRTAFLVVPALLLTALAVLASVHVRRAVIYRGAGASFFARG